MVWLGGSRGWVSGRRGRVEESVSQREERETGGLELPEPKSPKQGHSSCYLLLMEWGYFSSIDWLLSSSERATFSYLGKMDHKHTSRREHAGGEERMTLVAPTPLCLSFTPGLLYLLPWFDRLVAPGRSEADTEGSEGWKQQGGISEIPLKAFRGCSHSTLKPSKASAALS